MHRSAGVVVSVGVEQGILLAMVLSVLDHLRRGYHPRDTVVVRTDQGGFRSIPVTNAPTTEDIEPGLVVFRFAASLYYANANQFGEEVHGILERSQGAPTWFCIDAAAIGDIDYSAGETIVSVHAQMREHGTRLVFADVDDDVKVELDRFGISELVGQDAFYSSVVEAVAAFRSVSGGTEQA